MSHLRYSPVTEDRVSLSVRRETTNALEYPGVGKLPDKTIPLSWLPCTTLTGLLQHECLLMSGYDLPFISADTRKTSFI
jgi:hypothetical protein